MIKLAYDNSSPSGDQICTFYDEENNIMNPPSDFGWFIYNLYGKSFDYLNDFLSEMLLNLSPIRCDYSYLDLLAKEFGIKKNPNWSDDEYRAYIIINTYNVMTVAGLEYVLNQIALTETDETTGEIKVTYQTNNFKTSDKTKDNQLVSDKYNDRGLLGDSTEEIVTIKVPSNVNYEIIEFIVENLPYAAVIK